MHLATDVTEHIPAEAFYVFLDKEKTELIFARDDSSETAGLLKVMLKRHGKFMMEQSKFNDFVTFEFTNEACQDKFFPVGSKPSTVHGVYKLF